MATTNLTIRVDSDLRKQAEQLFSDLGLSIGTAVNTFLRQSVMREEIPFRISKREVFNEESRRALEECKDIETHPEKYKSYNSFAEILAEVQEEMANEK